MNKQTTIERPTGAKGNTAKLYRMVMDKHICPYGLKSKWLLEHEGYTVEDHWLETREQTDAFKAKWDVKTTPQTFVGGERIGGYDKTRKFLGKEVKDPDAVTYTPVIAIFAMCRADGAGAQLGGVRRSCLTVRAAEWFVALVDVRAGDPEAARPRQLRHHVPGL